MSFNRRRLNLSQPSQIHRAAVPVSNPCRRMAKPSLLALAVLLYLFGATLPALAQDIQHTQNTADASLRSNLQVDPSTLGMTLQIPLGNYPGRAGVGMPVTISYSSKLWRIGTIAGFPGSSTYHMQSNPFFSEHSIAGWTTSLEAPEVEYLGQAQVFGADTGNPLCNVCYPTSTESPVYVDRLLFHLPDGSSHEMRKNDTVITSGTPPDDVGHLLRGGRIAAEIRR